MEISEEKEVDQLGINFTSSICNKYKITSTGECIEECPKSSPYYYLEYNETEKTYIKLNTKPPKYLFNKMCYEECPENTSPNGSNICTCNNLYYKDNAGNIICISKENCIEEYPYLNRDTKECLESLEKCDYFLRDVCYNDCPNDKILLANQNSNIKNYIKEKLFLNDNLVDKICICDINKSVWKKIESENNYYQDCLSSCPNGFIPEDISKECVINNIPNDNNIICSVKYENHCFQECPTDTCLTQEDPELKTCIKKKPNTQVFNGICFENFDELTKKIKTLSENEEIISTDSGIIIHAYSTNSDNDKPLDKNSNYSLVNLGDCEYKLKLYYNLSNKTELFILGIDYGVYLEDGTLLEHNKSVKNQKFLFLPLSRIQN